MYEETTYDAAGPFYKVRYAVPSSTGAVQYKEVIIQAPDIAEAQRRAPERIRAITGSKPFKITGCHEF